LAKIEKSYGEKAVKVFLETNGKSIPETIKLTSEEMALLKAGFDWRNILKGLGEGRDTMTNGRWDT
jgi:hypothetical protein